MDTRTNSNTSLPRPVAKGPKRAPRRFSASASRLAAAGGNSLAPRDIVTRQALEKAATPAASGSAGAALHLPAIAAECRTGLAPFERAEAFKPTPSIADLKPRGRDVAKDVFEAGNMLSITAACSGLGMGDEVACVTVDAVISAERQCHADI